MEPTSTASIRTARWLLGGPLAVNLYRAMTQSVTPGEAWNYYRFIAPGWTEALSHFDTNNHVLNTLLVVLGPAMSGAAVTGAAHAHATAHGVEIRAFDGPFGPYII